jgi:hypothetical protein
MLVQIHIRPPLAASNEATTPALSVIPPSHEIWSLLDA